MTSSAGRCAELVDIVSLSRPLIKSIVPATRAARLAGEGFHPDWVLGCDLRLESSRRCECDDCDKEPVAVLQENRTIPWLSECRRLI